jgi:hypothetical protein
LHCFPMHHVSGGIAAGAEDIAAQGLCRRAVQPGAHADGRVDMAAVERIFLFIHHDLDPAVDIPTSILGLLGISSTTYLAAVLVDHNNTAKASSQGFWKDISGGDNVELHRLQIIAWTVVLAFVFVVRIFTKLSIPDFNPTLLGLLGMSAGTYVGFKFPENKSSTEPAAAPKDAEPAKKMAAGAGASS